MATRLESFTDTTVTSRADLQAQLETVRDRGWASVREELEIGLNAVAAPVYDADADVVAALSVSGPSYRLGECEFDAIAKVTVAAAEGNQQAIGLTAPPRPAPRETSRGRASPPRDGRPLNRQSSASSPRAATAVTSMAAGMASFKLARRELR